MGTISNVGPFTWDHFQRGTVSNLGPLTWDHFVSDPGRWVSTETGLDPAGPTLSHDFSDFSNRGAALPKIDIKSRLKVGPAGSKPVSVDTHLAGSDTTKSGKVTKVMVQSWSYDFNLILCPFQADRCPPKQVSTQQDQL